MIDRQARDQVSHLINRYLNDGLTAFELDDLLFRIRTNDYTANYVIFQMWYFYDDCKDHKVHLDKQAWDYLQRLLLILHSNAEIRADQHARRKWSWENLLAGLTLLAFIGIIFASHLGIWMSWVLLSPLLFPIVFFIYRRRDRQQKEKEKNHPSEDIALTPFSSVTEILRLRRKTLFFKKQSYPREIGMRKIRGKLEELSMKSAAMFLLPVLPLALLLQCIPVLESKERHILTLPD